MSKVNLPLYTTGTGIYDKKIIELFRKINDPYPYLKGLAAEIEEEINLIPFKQPRRLGGQSKNNFFTIPNRNSMYDIAMLGFVNHSKLPLRVTSFIGFTVAVLSLLIALIYFVYKLIYWNDFSVGIAPLIIGIFFLSGLQLVFLGIIGEYIGSIYTQVKKRPLVIEKERINFDDD